MNLYGYWQYKQVIKMACGIKRYDLVYISEVKDDMVHAINERGQDVFFTKDAIVKGWFKRPSYQYHEKCDLGSPDCCKCQMREFKQTVKRFKIRRAIEKLEVVKCCYNCGYHDAMSCDPPECTCEYQKAVCTSSHHVCDYYACEV
jgi:hypothetical protein